MEALPIEPVVRDERDTPRTVDTQGTVRTRTVSVYLKVLRGTIFVIGKDNHFFS